MVFLKADLISDELSVGLTQVKVVKQVTAWRNGGALGREGKGKKNDGSYKIQSSTGTCCRNKNKRKEIKPNFSLTKFPAFGYV